MARGGARPNAGRPLFAGRNRSAGVGKILPHRTFCPRAERSQSVPTFLLNGNYCFWHKNCCFINKIASWPSNDLTRNSCRELPESAQRTDPLRECGQSSHRAFGDGRENQSRCRRCGGNGHGCTHAVIAVTMSEIKLFHVADAIGGPLKPGGQPALSSCGSIHRGCPLFDDVMSYQ